MSLKGRTAIVTGSTSGIGLGIATAFAQHGANIMLNGFGDPATIEKIKHDLSAEHGIKVAYSGADMTKPAEIAKLVADTASQLGSVDILVNNAGIQFTALVEDFPDDKWDAIIAINLSAAFHTAKAALPLMKKAGWGRIINIASAHGLVASAQKVAYVSAKHGLIGMTKVIALETANDGITANAVCPGWVLTPLVEKQIRDRAAANGTSVADEEKKLLSEKQPMHKFTTPQQLAELALFLCSDGAATVTGSAFSMDGGWVAQ
ncbi:MAG TPA: 3-hydroxybutyrate dehydrogenase [Stellaceae bacterium]|nr:3-hydroxybutyrate dehydrogenase [Stellaceae bacterium]